MPRIGDTLPTEKIKMSVATQEYQVKAYNISDIFKEYEKHGFGKIQYGNLKVESGKEMVEAYDLSTCYLFSIDYNDTKNIEDAMTIGL